jgi:opacity protein-like surface antigen
MAFSSVSAQAQDPGGLYLEAFAGPSMLRDTDVTGNVRGEATFKSGPVVGAAVGYDYANSPFRSELEFIYRSGDAKTFAGSASGDFASTTFMANGYYDFKTEGSLTPFAGAGVGYVTEIDFDIAGGAGTGQYNDRGGFAWQAMGGINYALTNRIGLSGELRYFDAGSRTLNGSAGSIKAGYASLDAILGVRYRF